MCGFLFFAFFSHFLERYQKTFVFIAKTLHLHCPLIAMCSTTRVINSLATIIITWHLLSLLCFHVIFSFRRVAMESLLIHSLIANFISLLLLPPLLTSISARCQDATRKVVCGDGSVIFYGQISSICCRFI